MFKQISSYLIIALTIGALSFYSCGSSGKKSSSVNSSDTCKIRVETYGGLWTPVAAEDEFFSLVKSRDYCKNYVFMRPTTNEYGYTVWKVGAKVEGFSKEDYEEMRKYARLYDYSKKVGYDTYTVEYTD